MFGAELPMNGDGLKLENMIQKLLCISDCGNRHGNKAEKKKQNSSFPSKKHESQSSTHGRD